MLHSPGTYLDIDITESPSIPTELVVGLEKLDRGSEPFQIDHDILGVLRTSMVMHRAHGVRKRDSKEAGLGVLHLPDPPQAVQRAVVEIEDRVAG